jgi:hypothetical protein
MRGVLMVLAVRAVLLAGMWFGSRCTFTCRPEEHRLVCCSTAAVGTRHMWSVAALCFVYCLRPYRPGFWSDKTRTYVHHALPAVL